RLSAASRGFEPQDHPAKCYRWIAGSKPGNDDNYLSRFGREFFALLDGFLDGADHVERRFRQMIVLALAKVAEPLDGVGEIDELAGRAGEHFGDMERLRQETLDLAGARDGELVLFRQFVHAENGDDVLKRFVALQN